jgi:hypothetical protein
MRLLVLAVGHARGTSEGALIDDYIARANAFGKRLGLSSTTVEEVAISKLRESRARVAEEGERLAARIPGSAHVIFCDARGKGMTSEAFAEMIGAMRDAGARSGVSAGWTGRSRPGTFRQSRPQPGFRAADLAAFAGAGDARRAALPLADDPGRTPLPPRLTRFPKPRYPDLNHGRRKSRVAMGLCP